MKKTIKKVEKKTISNKVSKQVKVLSQKKTETRKPLRRKKVNEKSSNSKKTTKSSLTKLQKERIENIQRRVVALENSSHELATKYGKSIEELTNIRYKIDLMLGEILKGLYIIGISPDDIVRKLNQMFEKKESPQQ